jgi:hypothetical protein
VSPLSRDSGDAVASIQVTKPLCRFHAPLREALTSQHQSQPLLPQKKYISTNAITWNMNKRNSISSPFLLYPNKPPDIIALQEPSNTIADPSTSIHAEFLSNAKYHGYTAHITKNTITLFNIHSLSRPPLTMAASRPTSSLHADKHTLQI